MSTRDRRPDDATARLALFRPTDDDTDEVFGLMSDPRVWEHFPSLRHTDRERTARTVEMWQRHWAEDGLGTWVARDPQSHGLLACGGATLIGGALWSIGYRVVPEARGRGLATELARHALQRARDAEPLRPAIAYLVEHNLASAAVAAHLGFMLVDRGPDAGNPDPGAVRLVFADRALTPEQLDVARGGR